MKFGRTYAYACVCVLPLRATKNHHRQRARKMRTSSFRPHTIYTIWCESVRVCVIFFFQFRFFSVFLVPFVYYVNWQFVVVVVAILCCFVLFCFVCAVVVNISNADEIRVLLLRLRFYYGYICREKECQCNLHANLFSRSERASELVSERASESDSEFVAQ